MQYKLAPDVDSIAREIIREHHPHLMGADLICALRDDEPKKAGKDQWSKVSLLKGLKAFLTVVSDGEDRWTGDVPIVFIEVTNIVWKVIEEPAKRALIDHELCHVIADPQTNELTLHGHDVEEFASVIARHGFWNKDVRAFIRGIEKSGQLRLELEEIERDSTEVTISHSGGSVDTTLGGMRDAAEYLKRGGKSIAPHSHGFVQ